MAKKVKYEGGCPVVVESKWVPRPIRFEPGETKDVDDSVAQDLEGRKHFTVEPAEKKKTTRRSAKDGGKEV